MGRHPTELQYRFLSGGNMSAWASVRGGLCPFPIYGYENAIVTAVICEALISWSRHSKRLYLGVSRVARGRLVSLPRVTLMRVFQHSVTQRKATQQFLRNKSVAYFFYVTAEAATALASSCGAPKTNRSDFCFFGNDGGEPIRSGFTFN